MSADEFNVQDLSADVKSGKVQMVSIVERLQPLLTTTNIDERVKGVQILSQILADLPPNFLTKAELSFISTFYTEKLKDNHRVVPAVLDGVLTLIKMRDIPGDAPAKMLNAIFSNVPCQQQVRADRYNIYSILNNASVEHIEDIRNMGPDYILGLILMMDGERDPRNLFFLFSIIPTILKKIRLRTAIEEMFEVMACYFPVDFNMPQDEVNTITRNDLADKLSYCLCAVPSFSEFCIPLILEKLSSSLKVAKLDSLMLLKRSCAVFTPESYEPHLSDIFKELEKELSKNNDNEILEFIYETLTEFVNKLCSSKNIEENSEIHVMKLLDSMLFSMNTSMLRSYEVPLGVFLSISKSSKKYCLFIAKSANTLLLNQLKNDNRTPLKISILSYLKSLFEVCKGWNALDETMDDFAPFTDKSLEVLSNCESEMRVIIYIILSNMMELVKEEQSLQFKDILYRDVKKESSVKVLDACRALLLALAKKYPSIYDSILTEFVVLQLLMEDTVVVKKRLDIMWMIASIDHFSDQIFNNFLMMIPECDQKFAVLILESLLHSFKIDNLYNEHNLQSIQDKHKLIEKFLHLLLVKDFNRSVEVQQHISNIIITIMRVQSSEVQTNILSEQLSKYLNMFFDSNNSSIIILEALLNSTRTDVHFEHVEEIIFKSFDLCINHTCEKVRRKACTLIVNIFNKYIKFEHIHKHYDTLKDRLLLLLRIKDDNMANALTLVSWLTKGFCHNRHSDASFWLFKLLDYLHDDKLVGNAVEGVKLILEEDKDVLNKNCYSVTNFLYRQRVFIMFFENMNPTENHTKPILRCWMYILRSVPKSVLLMELPKISSIIVESLTLDDPECLIITLEILSYTIQKLQFICSLQTLLPRCLQLSEKTHPVKVRVVSLQCLYDVAKNYSTEMLLSHKQDVVFELLSRLDDPKRIVRSIAVKASTRWNLVGSPGEDKQK